MGKHMVSYAGSILQAMANSGGEQFAVLGLAMQDYIAQDYFLQETNTEYPPEALELLKHAAQNICEAGILLGDSSPSSKREIIEKIEGIVMATPIQKRVRITNYSIWDLEDVLEGLNKGEKLEFPGYSEISFEATIVPKAEHSSKSRT